jgi:hypothetical protein
MFTHSLHHGFTKMQKSLSYLYYPESRTCFPSSPHLYPSLPSATSVLISQSGLGLIIISEKASLADKHVHRCTAPNMQLLCNILCFEQHLLTYLYQALTTPASTKTNPVSGEIFRLGSVIITNVSPLKQPVH